MLGHHDHHYYHFLVSICSEGAIATLLLTAHIPTMDNQVTLLGGNFVVGSNIEVSSSLISLLVRRLDSRSRRVEMRIRGWRSGVLGTFR